MNLRMRALLVAPALAVVLTAGATAAHAEDPPLPQVDAGEPTTWQERIDAAAASGALDVPSAPRAFTPDATQKKAIADALRAYVATPGIEKPDLAAVQAQLKTLAGNPIGGGGNAVQVNASPTYKNLYIPHQAQQKGYYCGPASAAMMLGYLNRPTSRYDGVALSQANLATATYLRTEANGATTWASGAMATGMNRWIGGTWYAQITRPSSATTVGAFLSTIGTLGQPLAMNTVEFEGGAHYNGHPNRTIGHWIVGYGYGSSGATSWYNDPATSYYPNASATFQADTASFSNTYLQSNGIMY